MLNDGDELELRQGLERAELEGAKYQGTWSY